MCLTLHLRYIDSVAVKHFCIFFLIFLTGFTICCNPNNNKSGSTVSFQSAKSTNKPDSTGIYNLLTSQMTDTVTLDRFLDKITHQEKVRVLAELNTTWDDKEKVFVYSGNKYIFKLRYNSVGNSGKQKPNSVFNDGDTRISFKDYHITCYHDSLFRCEDYGFNLDNILNAPKVIEVCDKQFLYADISYWCNGIGCGCFLTFIYDLQNHKPTFIENYRIPYKGFFISDFNNDNVPDLLVISSTLEHKMKGFDFDEFELRIAPFSYYNGVFEPHFDRHFQRNYCYQLYSFTDVYDHSYHSNLIYSVTINNWFRQ
jgi:hypothetical protein